MTEHDAPHALLDRIYELGDHVRARLEAGDVDSVLEVVQERGALVERLAALQQPLPATDALRQSAARFVRQDNEIGTAFARLELRFTAALEKLSQVKQAQTLYVKRHRRPQILDRNIRG